MISVLKVGGALLDDPQALDCLASALSRARGQWVVVHGGGPQLDQALGQLGEVSVRIGGLRVTSPAAAVVIRQEMDLLGEKLASSLASRGTPTLHVASHHLAFQGYVKELVDGDLGRVGTVAGVDLDLVVKALDDGQVAVVTPIAWDAAGPLNVNADEAAAALATAIGADRLVLATSVEAVLDAAGRPIAYLSVAQAEAMIGHAASGGMIPKLRAANQAIQQGVACVVIGAPTAATFAGSTGTTVRPEHLTAVEV